MPGLRERVLARCLCLAAGEAETEAFWREFLCSLVARGLMGVQLAISDAHRGLKAALAQTLGAPGRDARFTSAATAWAMLARTSMTCSRP